MELIKKNIHMDRYRCKAATQITLDDDRNVPDNKPDMEFIIFNQGNIRIDEIKAGEDRAQVSGKLFFNVLYISEEEGRKIGILEGSIPFQEQIYMEGLHNNNAVMVQSELEDLTTTLINSRKFSVQAVLSLTLCVDEIVDEETSVDINVIKDGTGTETMPIEFRKKAIEISELAIQKKDVFRIKEEVQLPSDYPNIFELLWKDVQIHIPEVKAMEEKLSLQGEMTLFFLYEGEGEEHPIRWYEAKVPINGEIECHGCKDTFIPEVQFNIPHIEMDVRPDFDGEERVVGIEIPMELQMKMYEQENIDIISDVYGIRNEINAVTKTGHYKNLLIRNNGKFALNDKIKIDAEKGRILQICHCEGTAQIDDIVEKENGIEIEGSVFTRVLYVTNEDRIPFQATEANIPFRHMVDVPGMQKDCEKKIHIEVADMNATMIDSEQMDVKLNLAVSAIVFQQMEEEIITDIQTEDLDVNKLRALPSIVVYIVKPGDTLWQIGKKYYMSVDQIKAINNLTSDAIYPGDKLILVKNICM